VVLSRRLMVLLVALVVVIVLGIIGVLGAVGSASPGNAANDRTAAKARTLTVVTKTREREVVDLGPQGVSHGDLRVTNAPLYDATGKERIGRLDLLCVVTDPADVPAEEAHMAECTYTYTLPGGEISVQGVQAFPKLPELTPGGVDAITGGTGKYAGVEGEVRFEPRGTTVVITFHFIG
jgi:hypothetical protein